MQICFFSFKWAIACKPLGISSPNLVCICALMSVILWVNNLISMMTSSMIITQRTVIFAYFHRVAGRSSKAIDSIGTKFETHMHTKTLYDVDGSSGHNYHYAIN